MASRDTKEPMDWAHGSMTFKVDIGGLQEDFFIREIADRLVEQVSKNMIERIESTANELIEQRLRARMDAIIADVIEKGMTTPMQPSDAFSHPKGEPITAAEFIALGAEQYLEAHVNSEGKPSKPGSYSHTQKRMEYFLSQVVTKQFSDEIGKQVREITMQIREQMKSAAAAWLAKFQAETVVAVEKAKALAIRI